MTKNKILRKVQRCGPETLYISLPKFWCVQKDVTKKDILAIFVDIEGNLIISKENDVKKVTSRT
jgi:phosphate uptake regulator